MAGSRFPVTRYGQAGKVILEHLSNLETREIKLDKCLRKIGKAINSHTLSSKTSGCGWYECDEIAAAHSALQDALRLLAPDVPEKVEPK